MKFEKRLEKGRTTAAAARERRDGSHQGQASTRIRVRIVRGTVMALLVGVDTPPGVPGRGRIQTGRVRLEPTVSSV